MVHWLRQLNCSQFVQLILCEWLTFFALTSAQLDTFVWINRNHIGHSQVACHFTKMFVISVHRNVCSGTIVQPFIEFKDVFRGKVCKCFDFTETFDGLSSTDFVFVSAGTELFLVDAFLHIDYKVSSLVCPFV